MKMAQLCKESGFKRSTIHHYITIGLLDRPRKIGLNIYSYHETHLEQLRQIRHLRDQEKIPLSVIREILHHRGELHGSRPGELLTDQKATLTKEQILDVATKLFSQKGYEKTTISNIIDELRMGKGTFYLFFQDKQELFIECIERLQRVLVPKESWEDIRDEENQALRAEKRLIAFLKVFPGYQGILNLVRFAMGGDDPKLAQRAKDAFRAIIQPIVKDVSRFIENGAARELNPELLTYAITGATEMLGYRLMMDDEYSFEDIIQFLMNFFQSGFHLPEQRSPESGILNLPSADVRDSQGITTRVQRISFDKKPFINGLLGEAEVQIELDNIASLVAQENGSKITVAITLKDDQQVRIDANNTVILSGQALFGNFSLPIKGLSHISLIESA